MRYATGNNFMGQPIPGYRSSRCILTRDAAVKLKEAQTAILKQGYSLKVYDCYRPQKAVNAFYNWSKQPTDIGMKSLFYPREQKNTLFDKGYIAQYSGHTRGSTVDITLVNTHQQQKSPQSVPHSCPSKMNDNSINMGTPFDCFDKSTRVFYNDLSNEQRKNRMLLRNLMMHYGFVPYSKEWWHFTLSNEPYPHTYFNFEIQ
jgi:D-alanyl-D-alanine dipeptidase